MVKALHTILDLSGASDPPGELFPAVIKCAELLHTVPEDAPTILVDVDALESYPGRYYAHADGTPRRIAVNPACVRPRLTFLHEVAHFLDHGVMVEAGVWTSPTDRFDGWRDAVENSDAIEQLENLVSDPPLVELGRLFGYSLGTEELFARSYVEWVVVRSGDDTLHNELGHSISTLKYPEYWGFEDFAPIADQLDIVFEELGWKI